MGRPLLEGRYGDIRLRLHDVLLAFFRMPVYPLIQGRCDGRGDAERRYDQSAVYRRGREDRFERVLWVQVFLEGSRQETGMHCDFGQGF